MSNPNFPTQSQNDARYATPASVTSAIASQAMTDAGQYSRLQDVSSTVSANGTLVINKHNPIDSSSATLNMALPDGQTKGTIISIEKADSVTTYSVNVYGNIRGSQQTINLALPREVLTLVVKSDGSWWPVSDRRSTSSLDTRYSLQGRGIANVKDFGAVGDGSTDDTAAIQSALNSGRAVYVPKGTYSVTALANNYSNSIYGDGMNTSIIKARTGATTLYTATQKSGLYIQGLWFDCNSIAATAINTDWDPTNTGAPSLNCSYRDVRVSGYTSVGWSARSNNDCEFSSLLFDASGTNVSLRSDAPGGLLLFNRCKFFGPLEVNSQANSLVGCVTTGVRVTGGDWNVLQVHGGYWYDDATYHCDLYLSSSANMFPGSVNGAHIENDHSDGFIIGGSGKINGSITFTGCHIFGFSAGLNAAGFVQTTVGKVGPWARIMVEGGSVNNLAASATANPTAALNVYVTYRNTVIGAAYTNSRVEIPSSDGGSFTYLEHGVLRHSDGYGLYRALMFTNGSATSGTATTITNAPRSGILSLRGNGDSDPSIQVAYNRVGSAAGTVTTLASANGSGGGSWTVTIPAGNSQSGLVTDITISQNNGNSMTWLASIVGI